jgi:peptidyl-prolyl cis-trans isomerase D
MVLQSIRDRLTGIIAIFIFAILIIPFAFVGVSSYFTSDAVNAVAVVNDQEITINEFNQSFQNYRRRMQAQLGAAFDPEMFDQPVIRRQFLDQMIDEELLVQLSEEAGLAVDDARLRDTIVSMESFHVDGEFNEDVYQARLAAQGLTPRQFQADVRASLTLNQFPSAISGSAIATHWEMEDYVRLMEQTRTFRAVVVSALPADEEAENTGEADDAAADESEEAPASEDLPVSEEAILDWYEEHKDEYLSEEQVVIDYLELDAATLGGSIEPDEEVLRARFEEQQARFVTPESRLASHILIELDSAAPEVDIETAREQAEDFARQAREGADFAELAREHSQDLGSAEAGGDLGWVEPGFMVQAFEEGLYALTMENPVSEPIRTGFGWHVILLREIRPSEGMTYTEARDILAEEYRAEDDERRYIEQADRMVDIIYEDPTTLEAAAEELGLEVQTAGPFGRAGAAFGIAANPGVVSAAFSDLVLGQGAVSDPVDLGINHIVVVLVREHMPVAQLALEEVRDQVVAAVRTKQAMDAAGVRAQELLDSLNAGADLASLAEAPGLELVETEGLVRTSPAVDQRLREQVFLLDRPEEGSPVRAVVELDEGFAVVELTAVSDGAFLAENEGHSTAYNRRISNASASAEAYGFMRMLRAQSVIEVFEDRL